MPEDRNRPLLPAPSRGSLPPSGPSRAQAKKEITSRTSTACEACKRRKSRCVGRPPPCQMCKTSGTECIIDESLDQRRKISAKRLAEQADLQRELLISILQCLQHGQQSEVQELIRRIRDDESAQATATFLRRTVRNLHLDPKAAEHELDEILEAFGATPLDQEDTPSRSEPSENSKDSPSVAASPLNSTNPDSTHFRAFDERRDMTYQSVGLTPQEALRQTYERWSRYCMGQSIAEQVAGPGASSIGWTGSNEMQNQNVNREIMWPQMASSPGLGEQPAFFSSFNDRTGWHPVLRIIPTSDNEEKSPASASSVDFEEQKEQASIIGDASQTKDLGYVEILRFFPPEFSPHSSRSPAGIYSFSCDLRLSRFAIHSVQPLSNFENSPLGRIITDFRKAGRKFIANGNSPIQILGEDAIEVDLLMRDRIEKDESSVANWACEIWRSFDDWDIYVRLANVLFFTYLMRWTLVPTAEQYSLIPDFLKPSPAQCLVPHHAAIDFIPFPSLRNGLISHLRDWMTAFPAARISVNWLAGMANAVYRDQKTGETKISQSFKNHVTNLQNWSIGRSVLTEFPEFANAGIQLIEEW